MKGSLFFSPSFELLGKKLTGPGSTKGRLVLVLVLGRLLSSGRLALRNPKKNRPFMTTDKGWGTGERTAAQTKELS